MGESKKIKPPVNYDFESSNNKYDFTKICRDMMKSKAWSELTVREIGLYLHLKSKFTVNIKTLETNKDDISIPTSEAVILYKNNMRAFRIDIDELIEHGFIRQRISGWNTRTVNIYGFSDMWKYYGTENFKIEDKDRRYKPKKE